MPIGLCHPGIHSPQTGLVKNAPNCFWIEKKPFQKDLHEALGREVFCENDGNCFALSEAIDGSGKNITIIENFGEDYNDFWSTIKPTKNSLGDSISIKSSSKNQISNLSETVEENFLRFRWTNIDPGEYRGIWYDKGLKEIPALADKNFLKKY